MANNNWYVITGAPHSGKTSVIKLLKKEGFRVELEAARVYIDDEIAKGRTLEDIRKDELEFQKGILDMKIKIEESLPRDEIIFFDRAIPDSDAYYELCGFSGDRYLEKRLADCQYKKVFLFDLLPYKKDYARVESEEEQILLQKLLEKSYQKIDVAIARVLIMKSKEERLKFILDNL